ncbi:MAG TPA: helix-turn-helix domain-containing protein [Anaerolineaceae bacterium]|nr:helix-turn-helix domain-containing protein [Anaerolineaceae bacterium]
MNQILDRDNEALVLLNAREAAEYLRVSLSTLNRMERRGQLCSLRTPGGHRRYTLAMLNNCLAHNGPPGTK